MILALLIATVGSWLFTFISAVGNSESPQARSFSLQSFGVALILTALLGVALFFTH